jgi:hypothetical protein
VAHVVKLNEENIVVDVQVINNSDLPSNGDFSPGTESAANEFQHSLGLEGKWLLTSYNNNFRYHYAGIGYTFDPDMGEHGAFIPPQPFPSWTLAEDANWQPPVPMPDDGETYVWDEDMQEWQALPD